LRITFDRALAMQPTALANWVLTLLDTSTMNPFAAIVDAPADVALQFPPLLDVLSIAYLATPPDVKGAGPNGSFAGSFDLFFS
jgi:hypothetical protein